jgi:predicted transcriptional regulator
MKVLLSIRPEFASRIFDGSKGYEYRRTIFKRTEVTTIVVYASEPIKKVIGEFEIGEIIYEKPQTLWEWTGEQAGITKERFLDYFKDKTKGYAIKVKAARTYDTPIPLNRLIVGCPPQSFIYL